MAASMAVSKVGYRSYARTVPATAEFDISPPGVDPSVPSILDLVVQLFFTPLSAPPRAVYVQLPVDSIRLDIVPLGSMPSRGQRVS